MKPTNYRLENDFQSNGDAGLQCGNFPNYSAVLENELFGESDNGEKLRQVPFIV